MGRTIYCWLCDCLAWCFCEAAFRLSGTGVLDPWYDDDIEIRADAPLYIKGLAWLHDTVYGVGNRLYGPGVNLHIERDMAGF